MDVIARGRADLVDWLDDQPDDFYQADPCLRALHASGWSALELDRFRPGLERFGKEAAGPLDAAVRENNLGRNLPVLDPYDGVGRRSSPVDHHPSYHTAGRLIYGSGVMSAYAEQPNPHRYILSLFYLSSHVGEGGHNCPLACTAGAIRALQALGTDAQKARYLGPLLEPAWDENFTAAQFLTEVQGGSDVGANGTRAVAQPDGSYRIYGEKWFCSNIDADVILMTARLEGGPSGTRGLGMFLVPAWRPDGAVNDFRIRRLKDKLGTRSMASAEVDFDGTWAEAVGPPEVGFRSMMNLVINTSRVYNAFSVTGLAHRAYLVAAGYARHRRAFGAAICEYPLVQETLAHMLADSEACLAGSWLLAGLQEKLDRGEASEDEQAFFRVGLNVNKLRTSALAHQVINQGIEVLGGNGAIESFSVLPRLLRDNVVCENWEGTHNTLRLQTLRDCARMGVHHGFFRYVSGVLGEDIVAPVRARLDAVMDAPPDLATLMMRPAADALATLVHLTGLAPLRDEGTRLRAALTRRRHLEGGEPVSADYLERIPGLLERCVSNDLPPAVLYGQDFDALGLRFPLFQAPVNQAREYAGPGRCDLCFTEDAHCFSLESGSELVAECPACLEEAPLAIGPRADGLCPRCRAGVEFPLAREGRLRACAACLQAGLVSLGKRTELGEVRWSHALEGLTGGGAALSHPDVALVTDGETGWFRGVVDRVALLELVRTPGFDSWSGAGRWLFCCGRPMIYKGGWGADDFLPTLGGGERMFLNTIEGATPAQWSALNQGGIETHVFACDSCGQLRGRWEAVAEDDPTAP